MRGIFLLFGLGLSVCAGPQPFEPDMEVPFDEPFVLRIGQAAEVAGTSLSVRFDEVREDSRCPTDVVCVWGGNARVRLTVLLGGAAETLDLNTGLDPRSADLARYRLTLEDLQPEPTTSTVIRGEDYLVTLRVGERPEP